MHRSTLQLEADIRTFIDKHNQGPKPFKWTKSADDILTAVDCPKVHVSPKFQKIPADIHVKSPIQNGVSDFPSVKVYPLYSWAWCLAYTD